MRKFAKGIVAGLEDAIAHARGDKSRGVETVYTVPVVDVKSIRVKTGMTQQAFCQMFAIKPRTLQDWEQKRKRPAGSARILLALIDQHPATVKKTLRALGHSFEDLEKSKKVVTRVTKIKTSVKKIGDPKSSKKKRVL